ncbi:MAG: hypothetical protein ACXACY_28715 [Candidatus Hodarchaeales archaeon]|jgi:hypothetical protein
MAKKYVDLRNSYDEDMPLSLCCAAPGIEINDNVGICCSCRDWAEFKTNKECDQDEYEYIGQEKELTYHDDFFYKFGEYQSFEEFMQSPDSLTA